MAADVSASVSGLDDLRRALSEIPRELRKKVILAALRKAARVPLLEARRTVPVMSSFDALKTQFRTPGLLKKQLVVRTSKQSRRQGNIGVFVNVRPAKKGMRGAKSKSDPFYWRFVEFGTKKMNPRPFIKPASETLPKALEVFKEQVIPQINRFNSRKT